MTFWEDILKDKVEVQLAGKKTKLIGRVVNSDWEKGFIKLEVSEGGITTIGDNGYYWINLEHIVCMRNAED